MNVKEFCETHEITLQASPVPENPNLLDKNWKANHWHIILRREGSDEILTCYYSLGIGHIEMRKNIRNTQLMKRELKWVQANLSDLTEHLHHNWHRLKYKHDMDELITGRDANGHFVTRQGTKFDQMNTKQFRWTRPTPEMVLESLQIDISDDFCGGFKSWAESLGYDPDSRSAEKTYNACIEQANSLRKFLGSSLFATFQTCTEDEDENET